MRIWVAQKRFTFWGRVHRWAGHHYFLASYALIHAEDAAQARFHQ